MKNGLIPYYTDYSDFPDYVKNGFVTDYTNYADIQDFEKNAHHWLRWLPSLTSNNYPHMYFLQELQGCLTSFTCQMFNRFVNKTWNIYIYIYIYRYIYILQMSDICIFYMYKTHLFICWVNSKMIQLFQKLISSSKLVTYRWLKNKVKF